MGGTLGKELEKPFRKLNKNIEKFFGLRGAGGSDGISFNFEATDTVLQAKMIEDLEKLLAELSTEEARLSEQATAIVAYSEREEHIITQLHAEINRIDELIKDSHISKTVLEEQIISAVGSIIELVKVYPDEVKHQIIFSIFKEIHNFDPKKYSDITIPEGFDKLHLLELFARSSLFAENVNIMFHDEEEKETMAEFLIKTISEDAIETILERTSDINTKDKQGYTILHFLILNGKNGLVQQALDHGADPSIKFPNGTSCIYNSVIFCSIDVIERISSVTEPEPNLLHAACFSQSEERFEWAISRCRDINCQDKEGNTPLITALLMGSVHAIDKLLEMRADVNIVNNKGQTALHAAAWLNCADYVEAISARTADVNAKDENEQTTLHYLIKSIFGPMRIVSDTTFPESINMTRGIQALKDVQLRIDGSLCVTFSKGSLIHFNRGNITLGGRNEIKIEELKSSEIINYHWAIKMVKFLTEKGADINAQDNVGRTPFMLACCMKLFYFAKQLLNEFDIDFSVKDAEGYAAIHHTVHLQDPEIIELMVEKGADISQFGKFGKTILHWAVLYNNTELVQKIIELGGKIDEKQLDGYSPIHLAAINGFDSIIRLLHEKGADVNEQNSAEITPLYFAFMYDKNNAAKTLIELGANVDKPMNDGDTPFHMCAYHSNIEGFSLLVEAGANINSQNHRGLTPLHTIISYNKLTAGQKLAGSEFLLEHGGDPTICDHEGKNYDTYIREYLAAEECEQFLELVTRANYVEGSEVVLTEVELAGETLESDHVIA